MNQNSQTRFNYIRTFSEIGIRDIPLVGGKNASLGEMFRALTPQGIRVPDGFAVTAEGYRLFLRKNGLELPLSALMKELDTRQFENLADIGEKARALFGSSSFPDELRLEILAAARELNPAGNMSLAVRSSATAEDLPGASFAGQQETFLNVLGEENLIHACQRSFASLFTNRAIKYRCDQGFDHMKVAISIGIQQMVRSDLACSGVMFSLDPDSGFADVVLISGAWGLGENVVQGHVNTDEFLVFKTLLGKVQNPIISTKTGSKLKTMVFHPEAQKILSRPEDAIINTDTPPEKQKQLILNPHEIASLAAWAMAIEKHYGMPMDMEWAKDGINGNLYIVQARPETVHSQKKKHIYKQYTLTEKGKILCTGAGLGKKILSGTARILHSPAEIGKLQPGEILVTEKTDPDWDPVMKKAAAIITDLGGRTSHAAIVARELGAIAVIGTGNATTAIRDGQTITVNTAGGHTGQVFDGALKWEEKETDISLLPAVKTKKQLILAHPDEAFHYSMLPNDGVGLLRMEFIISNSIGIHPMALKKFDSITDPEIKNRIAGITSQFSDKTQYFIHTLAESVAKIAAAFYPREVIVRMSDFKSNEYAGLLGGNQFESAEENPMIGFRGASRYYHPLYREAFELECMAMKEVRENMGLKNVKLMIPFCRTTGEAEKVLEVMKFCGLERGRDGLEIYVMVEIPSNAILADSFAQLFDGFSIGSNDLTQLTLGADRDSSLLSEIFSPFDPAVMQLIAMTIHSARKTGTHCGLCGQAPSDYPEYARFLVENGIDSISFNPDALIQGIENIAIAEGVPHREH